MRGASCVVKKGRWSEEEDMKLKTYILRYGHWNWRLLPKFAGLARCGKSCRLRWMNYLKPGVERGNYTNEEQHLITKLHHQFGNKWSAIAKKLPGRTDNDIKNYWHTYLKKRTQLDSESESWKPCPANWYSEGSSTASSPSLQLQGSGFLCENVAENSNTGFELAESSFGSFWTDQFLVDTDSYIQQEQGAFFSDYVVN